jgi:hypothetical protein
MIDIEGARLLAMFIRSISVLLAALVAFAVCYGQTKKRSVIQWKPSDCTSPLMLPEGLYDLSQFGKGEYRIDGKVSVGHFNCIYFIFQPSAALNPETVARSDRILVCDQGHESYLAQLQDYRRRSSRHSQGSGHAEHFAA